MSQALTAAIVGQGYVGLPVAMRAVEVGMQVVGFDLDEAKIEALADGRSYIDDVTDADVRPPSTPAATCRPSSRPTCTASTSL